MRFSNTTQDLYVQQIICLWNLKLCSCPSRAVLNYRYRSRSLRARKSNISSLFLWGKLICELIFYDTKSRTARFGHSVSEMASLSGSNWYLGRINSDLMSWIFHTTSWHDWHFVYSKASVFASAVFRAFLAPRQLTFIAYQWFPWFTALGASSTFSHANKTLDTTFFYFV